MSDGPASPAKEEYSNMRPWIGPTYFDPNMSASYAGMIAKATPMKDIAVAVPAMKTYNGISPEDAVKFTRVGTER